MSEPVTRITDIDPLAFVASVEPDAKRQDAEVLDALFRRVTGEAPRMWGPSIVGYGTYHSTYASGQKVEWMRAGFSPRKAKHSLYLMGCYCDADTGRQQEELLVQLGKHSRGKSCLYINKLADVDIAVLEEMIAIDWAAMARLYPDQAVNS